MLCKWLKDNVEAGDIIFDIGARYGFYSVLISEIQPNVQIHAFEPSESKFRYLRRNRDNQVDEAVWDLIQKSVSILNSEFSVTLDQYCRQKEITPALIKIDIEGAEAIILREASEVIEGRETTFLIELHPKKVKCFGAQIEDIFDYFPEDYVLIGLSNVRDPEDKWTTELGQIANGESPYLYAAPKIIR
jgi:hypothetical protein